MPVRREELVLVLKGGGAHEVRELGMIILAESSVYSGFATNRTTVFLLKFLCMIGSNDEDMEAQVWLLVADLKLQLLLSDSGYRHGCWSHNP